MLYSKHLKKPVFCFASLGSFLSWRSLKGAKAECRSPINATSKLLAIIFHFSRVLGLARFILVYTILISPFSFKAAADLPTLESGWFPLDPYMYLEGGHEFTILTGFDIRIMEAVLQKAGYTPKFSEIPWKEFLVDIEKGSRQIGPFATETSEREKWAYFSLPYRWEENVLFVRHDSPFTFKREDVADMLAQIKASNFRLGVMDGFVYASPLINDFIADPTNADHIVRVKFEPDNLKNLLDGKIDGYLTDRIVGATMVWRAGKSKLVEERYLGISTPIHFILSKTSVQPQVLKNINNAITDMKKNGELSKIVRDYILPVILMQTVDRDWFLWIEMLAIISFVVAGIIIADQENLTVMAAFGLATVPSVGGGLLRDLIIGRAPVGVLVTPRYMLTVVISFLFLFVFVNLYDFFKRKLQWHWVDKITPSKESVNVLLYVADSLGTSAFTIVGVLVAVSGKADPLWLWGPLFAVLTGVGGSTMRNALAGYRPLGNEKIYTEIPFVCGFCLSVFLLKHLSGQIDPHAIFIAVTLTIIFGFSMHMVAFFFNIPPLRMRIFETTRKEV
ncbi:TRIC cation channel family protein [Candidatus Paracaedibacter symbiosus]|uniref:TRIC cation channel family protein n=1 Tax=Candidatus Paracaedibacter symbiosus TaxID=244582 RepID=UPI0005098B72|nr:transporter substrate-binding domain-containing protein [Candidatus Paracaedibacter symbiosus]